MMSAITTFGFQSTLSVRRATKCFTIIQVNILHFNPRSPWGERQWSSATALPNTQFQSTLSVRRATSVADTYYYQAVPISIHALREESDIWQTHLTIWQQISIHALREESDRLMSLAHQRIAWFQSTLSVRRATYKGGNKFWENRNFNPRSPWGERHGDTTYVEISQNISIHALREESDGLWTQALQFNLWISIHALREESDGAKVRTMAQISYFNPRSPWGERLANFLDFICKATLFQSTLSVRRATWLYLLIIQQYVFQSTLSVRRATLRSGYRLDA